jgi:hypothetical protein
MSVELLEDEDNGSVESTDSTKTGNGGEDAAIDEDSVTDDEDDDDEPESDDSDTEGVEEDAEGVVVVAGDCVDATFVVVVVEGVDVEGVEDGVDVGARDVVVVAIDVLVVVVIGDVVLVVVLVVDNVDGDGEEATVETAHGGFVHDTVSGDGQSMPPGHTMLEISAENVRLRVADPHVCVHALQVAHWPTQSPHCLFSTSCVSSHMPWQFDL